MKQTYAATRKGYARNGVCEANIVKCRWLAAANFKT